MTPSQETRRGMGFQEYKRQARTYVAGRTGRDNGVATKATRKERLGSLAEQRRGWD